MTADEWLLQIINIIERLGSHTHSQKHCILVLMSALISPWQHLCTAGRELSCVKGPVYRITQEACTPSLSSKVDNETHLSNRLSTSKSEKRLHETVQVWSIPNSKNLQSSAHHNLSCPQLEELSDSKDAARSMAKPPRTQSSRTGVTCEAGCVYRYPKIQTRFLNTNGCKG